MKVKFKKDSDKETDIALLLSELHKIKRLPKDGKDKNNSGFNVSFKSNEVSFIDSTKYNIINSMLVKSILDFTSTISNFSKDQIIKHSLNEVALKDIRTKDDFLKVLNAQYEHYYKGRNETEYNLLTSLSVQKLPFSSIEINGGTILIKEEFPEKFQKARSELYQKHYDKDEQSRWIKIIVTVKDRDLQDAFKKAQTCIEILRAFLCLQTASGRHPLSSKSINQILLGDFITMHTESGECCDSLFYWYEPINRNIALYELEKDESDLIKRQTNELADKLNECKPSHKKALVNGLNQYVSAYDLVQKDACFLKGWTVLENLLNTCQNETIVRRCVTKYENPDFNRLQIEALKNYRNELVHEVKSSNENDSEILTFCYILHRFISDQISSNLYHSGKLNSISDYAEYLDYLGSKKKFNDLNKKYLDFFFKKN